MALAVVLGGCLVITMALLTFIGGKALWVMALTIPILGLLKTISATDDGAVKILAYEVYCLFKRKNAKIFGGTTTVLATKYGRQKNDYQRFIEQNAKPTNRPRRFST